MGSGEKNRTHCTPSRAADGDAADAGPGFTQQLWSYGRYRWADAESRADNLWISKSERVIRRRRGRWREETASGRWWQSRKRAPGPDLERQNVCAGIIPAWR